MNRLIVIFLLSLLLIPYTIFAQTDSTKVVNDSIKAEKDTTEGWHFTTVDSVGITRVKDQNRSGTCWAFSTLGFLESRTPSRYRCGSGLSRG